MEKVTLTRKAGRNIYDLFLKHFGFKVFTVYIRFKLFIIEKFNQTKVEGVGEQWSSSPPPFPMSHSPDAAMTTYGQCSFLILPPTLPSPTKLFYLFIYGCAGSSLLPEGFR